MAFAGANANESVVKIYFPHRLMISVKRYKGKKYSMVRKIITKLARYCKNTYYILLN